MKKLNILILALACVLFLSFFISSEAAPKVEKITYWTWSNPQYFEGMWRIFVKDFPEYKDIKLETRSVPGESIEMMKEIMISYASGAEIPDITETNFKLNPMLVANGVLAETTKYIEPYTDYLPKVVLESATYKGKIYGYPLRGNSSMAFYRKDILAEAGVDVKDIVTWDDYLEAGKKVRALNKDIYMLSIDPNKPGWNWDEIMLGQHGIGMFDKETGEVIVDKDGALESYRIIDKIAKSGIATYGKAWGASWWGAIKDNKIASLANVAGWMTSILANNAPDQAGKWVAAPYPVFANGKQSMQGVMGYNVFTRDKAKQDILGKLIQDVVFNKDNIYAYEKANAINFSLLFYKDNPPEMPLWEKFYPGQEIKKLDLEILENALMHHYTPDYTEALNIVENQLSKCATGGKDIEVAVKDMAKEIKGKIGTSKY